MKRGSLLHAVIGAGLVLAILTPAFANSTPTDPGRHTPSATAETDFQPILQGHPYLMSSRSTELLRMPRACSWTTPDGSAR